MYPIIFSAYGLTIYSYGMAIALGLSLVIFLMNRDTRITTLLKPLQLSTAITLGIIYAIIGGKFVYLMTNYSESISLSNFLLTLGSGFSIMGSLFFGVIFVARYLKKQNLPIRQTFDAIAPYMALLQGFGRIGCFFAGCCYGTPFHGLWAIQYTDDYSLAPCGIMLHPTQLYSALLLFLLAAVLFKMRLASSINLHGIVAASYLLISGMERFLIDFLRAEHFEKKLYMHFFTIDQLWTLPIILCGIFIIFNCLIDYFFVYKKQNA